MLDPGQVSACLVTRGDVDMTAILESLPFDETIVYDNSRRNDLGIYGRYAAIAEARHDVIYTQDDDVLVSCFDELLTEYRPGVLTVNYPEPWDVPWVACGALFDRDLPKAAFERYQRRWMLDETFTHWTCDAVFGLLTPTRVVDFGYQDLPHGLAEGRVSTSPGWYDNRRPEVQRRCRALLESA